MSCSHGEATLGKDFLPTIRIVLMKHACIYWLVVMSPRAEAEGILGKAKELEKDYGWVEATALYEQALPMVGKRDFLRKGVVQERIGYCLHRGAFQAETPEQFRSRMLKAVEAYGRAHGFYEKLMGEQKIARMFRCRAVAKYLEHWLTSDPSEKRALLDECLELEEDALMAFSNLGDILECGRTYNELPLVFERIVYLEWDTQTSKNIGERLLKWGQKAVAALSELGNLYEIARANLTSATCLIYYWYFFIAEPAEKDKARSKALEYLRNAAEFSKRVEDAYLFGLTNLHSGLLKGGEESARHFEEALECGEKTRDNYLRGRVLNCAAHMTFWKATTTEDPDQRRKLAEKAVEFHEKAWHHLSKISFPSQCGRVVTPAEYYLYLAMWETGQKRKLEFLEKSEKAGMEALKVVQDSDIPYAILTVIHILGRTLQARARMVPDFEEKRRLLERALRYRERTIEIMERWPGAFGVQYLDLGAMHNYLAEIEAELADLELNSNSKRRLLEEAVSNEEKCLELTAKMLSHLEKMGRTTVYAALHRYQDTYGTLLNRLYELTNNQEHLRTAIEITQKAVKSANKLGMTSLMAESYWKIAKAQDVLGKHLKAAENFQHAWESYMLAAERIPQLNAFYSDYASYMKAWAEIENARHERENENYARSGEHYRKCSHHLETAKRWVYQSSYYFAWSFLEHGEQLSRLDKSRDAIKAFDEAGRTFGGSVNSLRMKAGKLESSEERDEASKLAAFAGLRKQYCMGRVSMEEAKLLNRKGDRLSSAKEYASAASVFERIAPNFEREEARRELEFAATLCRAWEKMELAEERRDAILYRRAAKLFAKAGEITPKKTAGLIAVGNSCFCEALELGTKFMITSNMDFYSSAKLRMENAAGYYRRAEFEKAALWVEATKRLFDAHVYAGKAEAEAEPEKRARLYLMTEKCLELSANLYGKAGYPDRRKEALQSLERMKKELRLALSLSEVLAAPAALSSTTGVSMPDSTEKAAGLNEFESVNIRARLSVPDEFVRGKEFQVKLDLVNVGKKPGLLVRVEGLVPRACNVLKMPSYCALEDDSLNLKGRRLSPLSVESVSVSLEVTGMVGLRLAPRVVYVDELGNFRTIRVEEAQILPAVTFESEDTQAVFTYLVDAFVEDSVRRRWSVEQAGWRSLPQIMKGAGVSKRSVYGAGGRVGSRLAELRRTGLVDLGTFRGRGRGGHILKARIHRENELVRRYVREKAPDLSV